MFVIVAKYLIPKGYRGLTVFPFVLIKYRFDSENKVLVNHEKIHIRQQLELLVLPFFLCFTTLIAVIFICLFYACRGDMPTNMPTQAGY